MKSHRTAKLERKTRETSISLSLDLDGQGKHQVSTGNGMLDHLVSQISRHSLIDISLQAKGDIEVGWHHLVEDCGIALGRALKEALGEARGIRRMGHAVVPLDESLSMVAVDLSGRGYASVDLQLDGQMAETLPGEMVHHFLESMALEGKFNLHAKVLSGQNAHHKAECTFKALAKALRMAVEADPRSPGDVPSTKGTVG